MKSFEYDPTIDLEDRSFHLELRFECDSIRTYGFFSLDDMESYLDDIWPDAFVSFGEGSLDAPPDFCDFWMYDDKGFIISSGRIWSDNGLVVEYKKSKNVEVK